MFKSCIYFLITSIPLFLINCQDCEIPDFLQGEHYSMEENFMLTKIDKRRLITTVYKETEVSVDGTCKDFRIDESSVNEEGKFNGRLLLYEKTGKCYRCFEFYYRTPNINQYRKSGCLSYTELDFVCGTIGNSVNHTFFRGGYVKVNCKNTFEGVYNFTYEREQEQGSICDSAKSVLTACQLPGSSYEDNHVFKIRYGYCPEVVESTEVSSLNLQQYACLGSWVEGNNVWAGVYIQGEAEPRERYRCLLTNYQEEEKDNKRRYTMSLYADCRNLKTAYNGDIRLHFQPIIKPDHLHHADVGCLFPANYSGTWFHGGEYDVFVRINITHIYFKTIINRYQYKEAYFICMMNMGTKYLTMAITVGKCELDYVCFDMLPRHQSIIRWRMAKPYRFTDSDVKNTEWKLQMFEQGCSDYSFTLNRNEPNWKYKTFLLDPPNPTPCPIRGRYYFHQKGYVSELIKTRIEGITVRPRNTIYCEEYVSLWQTCDTIQSKLSLDSEYCETVDHTGRPIGEYDIPDWELTCVGYWGEDWKSYMITWDEEDPTSPFRCWTYAREDWRFISVSRSTTSYCRPEQTAYSNTVDEGASLAFKLVEAERLYDDCSQDYRTGNIWQDEAYYFRTGSLNTASISYSKLTFPKLICLLFTVYLL